MKKTISASLSLLLIVVNLSAAAQGRVRSRVEYAATDYRLAERAGSDDDDQSGKANAQSTVELRGTVIDETMAYIAAATVVLDDGKGNKQTTVADDHGRYRFSNLKPGSYTITVDVEGFAKFSEPIEVSAAKRTNQYDVKLKVVIAEQVEVKDSSAGISTEPDRNLSGITLNEKDLETRPDRPHETLQTLKKMGELA